METLENQNQSLDIISQWAALLTAIEVGLGSILHGLKIPFSGNFLSLNQSFILCRLTLATKHCVNMRFASLNVSAVSALLKSLSPAGKKLTPMIAISSQGVLFNLATTLLGRNILGLIVGSLLIGLWPFLQPAIIYWLIFGSETIVNIGDFLLGEIHKNININTEQLLMVGIAVIAFKLLLSLAVAIAAYALPVKLLKRYDRLIVSAGRNRIRSYSTTETESPPLTKQILLALKDLTSPLFLFSIIATIFFYLFVDSDYVKLIWVLLRIIAIGFLFFFIVRTFPVELVLTKITFKPIQSLAQMTHKAFSALRDL